MSSQNRPLKFGPKDRREFIVQDSEVALRIEYDGANNPIYIGRAKVGVLNGEVKWQIQRGTYVGTNLTAVEWPQNAAGNASSEYEFEWDERATYTYS